MSLRDEWKKLTLIAAVFLAIVLATRVLGAAPATVSRHMSVLQNAGLVESRKNGRWVYYRLTETAKREPRVNCPFFPGTGKIVHVGFDDPAGAGQDGRRR